MQRQLNFIAISFMFEQTDKKAADGLFLFCKDNVWQS